MDSSGPSEDSAQNQNNKQDERPLPPAFDLIPENVKVIIDEQCSSMCPKDPSAYPNVQGPPPRGRTESSQTAPATSQVNYGPYSVFVRCPGCDESVNTKIELTIGAGTYMASFGCCLISLGLCSWVPFFSECTHDVSHLCPQCGRKLGIFKRL
ncbi:lipopolysaccharide-induced tumor necrosis factor-alpha factor homolog [Brevipalpus obovatus]|uniref:lipopolysaccharide-induced tumor necrosis factor-alpha factor homolog n=1 Tax=Brevipalpus obovatus TaxID=246614 RepID=UPI003D9DFBB7